MSTLIHEELRQMVTITENGNQRRVIVGRVIAKRLATQAAAGNVRAIEIIVKNGLSNPPEPSTDLSNSMANLNEQDESILKRALTRMSAAAPTRKDEGDE